MNTPIKIKVVVASERTTSGKHTPAVVAYRDPETQVILTAKAFGLRAAVGTLHTAALELNELDEARINVLPEDFAEGL